jgi:hypothetical protein
MGLRKVGGCWSGVVCLDHGEPTVANSAKAGLTQQSKTTSLSPVLYVAGRRTLSRPARIHVHSLLEFMYVETCTRKPSEIMREHLVTPVTQDPSTTKTRDGDLAIWRIMMIGRTERRWLSNQDQNSSSMYTPIVST